MKRSGVILIIWAVILLIVCGCSRTEDEKANRTRNKDGHSLALIIGEPSEYFPLDIGRTWTYRIDIGSVDPLAYRKIEWPVGEKFIVASQRRRLFPSGKTTFQLKLKVVASASKQGPLSYPKGVKVSVEKDELGIFRDVSNIFFAVSTWPFRVLQIMEHPPTSSFAPTSPWGSWLVGSGYSIRLIFFGEKPGTEIGLGDKLGDKPVDKLLFVGLDSVPGYKNVRGLHFVRTVDPSKKEWNEYLDKGFTEDTWFVRGIGLVRLEQRVDGKLSMTWTLTKFSDGK